MSWLSENVFDPVKNVGSALAHGDITGGQYQASGSDYLRTGELAALALGGAGLAGALGGAGLAFGGAEAAGGAFGGAEAAGGAGGFLSDLGISASPDALSAYGAADPLAAS